MATTADTATTDQVQNIEFDAATDLEAAKKSREMAEQKDGSSDTEIAARDKLKPYDPTNKVPPDGGYGWVVVFASFWVHFFVLGNIFSFGLLFRIYLEVFDASYGEVAWVGSVGAGLLAGLGLISGSLADRFGNGLIVCIGGCLIGLGFFLASFATAVWQLYLTQGIIAGVGYSLCYISGVSVVGQWFTKRRGLAVGIAVAGSGIGQLGLSFIIGALMTSFGWRIGLRYLALIDVSGIVFSGLLIRRFLPCYVSKSEDSFLSYFNDRNFTYMYLFIAFATMGIFTPFTHLPAYAAQYGISNSQIVILLAASGLFGAIGRVFVGFAADRIGRLRMMIICVSGASISTYCWMALTSFYPILIYSMLFGCFAGGVISLIPVVSAELFGIEKLGKIVGAMYTAAAFGNLLGAPISGFLVDIFGDYYVAISVAATFLLIGMCFLLFVTPANNVAKIVAIDSEVIAADCSNISSSNINSSSDLNGLGKSYEAARSSDAESGDRNSNDSPEAHQLQLEDC